MALILGGTGIYYGYTTLTELNKLKEEVIELTAFRELIKNEAHLAEYLKVHEDLGEILVEGMKEGKVIFYSCHTLKTSQIMADAFMEMFPFIEVEIVQASTWGLYERFKSEYDAGQYFADVFIGTGAPVCERLKDDGSIIPWDDPNIEYFPEDTIDPEGYFVAISHNTILLGVNKELSEDLWPTDWIDFLNPKPEWKGVSIYDPRISTTGYTLVYELWKHYGEDTAKQIWESIATLDPMFYTGTTPLTEALVAGEQDVTLYMMNYQYGPYGVVKGENIQYIVPASAVGHTYDGNIVLPKNAPHPNAAKVFIHWLLSEHMGEVYRGEFRFSNRIDVEPPEGLWDIRELDLLEIDEVEAEQVREDLLDKWATWIGV